MGVIKIMILLEVLMSSSVKSLQVMCQLTTHAVVYIFSLV